MSTTTIYSDSSTFNALIDIGELSDSIYSPTDRQRPESPVAKKPKNKEVRKPAPRPKNEMFLESAPDSQVTLDNVRKCLLVQHSYEFMSALEKMTNLTAGSSGMLKELEPATDRHDLVLPHSLSIAGSQ